MYADNLKTCEELKQSIRSEIRRIPEDMLTRVVDNFSVRFATVIQQHRAWTEHIINCDSENARILLRIGEPKFITL